MKAILSLIISGALVVSGFGQTRNVLVGTNNTVVQPTNFWSADASNARTGLGLGTAATNPVSAFQPASSALTNLASGNGGSLTNIQSTNLVGVIPSSNIATVNFSNLAGTLSIASGGTSATNAANARQNLGSTTVGDALFIATNAAAARTAIGATTVGSSVFTLANPSAITFLRLNSDNTASALSASDFRTALSLGTAATNPSSAFQSSSSALTNLSTNNGINLTNIPLAGVVGALATNGDAAGLTNLTAANITGTVALASNVTGTIAISNGGTGATNAGGARTNLGLGATNNVAFNSVYIGAGDLRFSNDSIFWAGSLRYSPEDQSFEGSIGINNGSIQFVGTNAAENIATTRTNLGLGATNDVFVGLSVGTQNTNLSTNDVSLFGQQNYADSSARESFAFGSVNSISNMPAGAGGSIVMGVLGNMTNQGAFLFNGVPQGGTVGNSRGNNTFAVNASNGIYLNGPTFLEGVSTVGGGLLRIGSGGLVSRAITNVSTGQVSFLGYDGNPDPSVAWTAFTPAQARTNLGLAWSALTNSNAGTGLVSVNTNGEVVSPTNFWQVSPANTRVQYFQPVVSSTNDATNARNLYLYSMALSTTGVVNTITLPTNTATFLGDVATVIHEAPTSSTTAIRQLGSATNIITLNQFQEAVQFIRNGDGWKLADNISQVEAIYFSGTNAAQHAAESRTNLGLPLSALTNTNAAKFQEAIFTTNAAPTNSANVNSIGFNTAVAWMEVSIVTNSVTNSYRIPLFK